jgi:hypothetical protein
LAYKIIINIFSGKWGTPVQSTSARNKFENPKSSPTLYLFTECLDLMFRDGLEFDELFDLAIKD